MRLSAATDAGKNGRSGRIRTCDPRVPNAVLYQTEPHSEIGSGLYRGGPAGRQPADADRGRGAAAFISPRRCAPSEPALSPPTGPQRQAPPVPAGEWCNGNTAVFGTVILGSSPSSPAKTTDRAVGAHKRHTH